MSARTPLIAGNWKMNLDHLQAIANLQKLAWSLEDAGHDYARVEVTVCPPFTDIRPLQNLIVADKLDVALGAQDLSPHDSGAYTGDVSGLFLKKLDVKYVIVGHSERRQYHGETDQTVAAKVTAALKHELVPIICVGESLADLEANGPAYTAKKQLRGALEGVELTGPIVVAYEPVWAIGSGKAATPEVAGQVCAELRETVADVFSADVAAETRVLYGGSVTSENIAKLMREPGIDGALVGGASLKPDEFSKIIRYQSHVVA